MSRERRKATEQDVKTALQLRAEAWDQLDLNPGGPLTDTEKAMLDLEALSFKYPARKASRIYDSWRISETAYYAIINRLIEETHALAYAPELVNRLRRVRAARQARRAANTVGREI